MFRHIEEQIDFKPVTEEQYEKLIIPLKKMGVTILRGDEEVECRLKKYGAIASAAGTDVVMFREKVSVSAILEETQHIQQNRLCLNDDKEAELRNLLNEIDVKKYLLRVASKYNIPQSETETTKQQLKKYERLLAEYYKQRGS